MKPEPVSVAVNILDKEFRIACPQEEREALLRAATYLNDKMREIRDTGKVIGADRVTIMAGLNIVHELLKYKTKTEEFDTLLAPRLLALQNKVEHLLEKDRQIEF